MTDWIILRTSGGSTLRLLHSMVVAGFEAWTPMELQVKRDRKNGARHERMIAVMPTYVFARAKHLSDLAALAMSPVSQHPQFSVFRYYDRFPLVADRELSTLRDIERKAAAKSMPVVFERGEIVQSSIEAFQGLTGEVVEVSKGQHTLVAFPGFHIPIKFASWQLSGVELETNHKAARAA